jgi:hypothetical protein
VDLLVRDRNRVYGGNTIGYGLYIHVSNLLHKQLKEVITMNYLDEKSIDRDIRLKATIWIWVLSIALLFGCVPIVALTAAGILLPFFVLLVLAIGTASIWLSSNNISNATKQQIEQLQARTSELETIVCREDIDKKFISLERVK